MLCRSHLPFLCPVEFSVLVDVSSERCCQTAAVGEDNICSLYQFTISSANTQPADKGERTYLILHFSLSLSRLIQRTSACLWECCTGKMSDLFILFTLFTLLFTLFTQIKRCHFPPSLYLCKNRNKSENMFRHVLSHNGKNALKDSQDPGETLIFFWPTAYLIAGFPSSCTFSWDNSWTKRLKT